MFGILTKTTSSVIKPAKQSQIQKLIKFQSVSLNGELLNVANKLENNKSRVVINLWATWCKPCLEEIPILNKMYDSLAGKNFIFIAISCDDSKNTVQNYLRDNRFKFTQIHFKDINTSSNIWDEFITLQNSNIQMKSLPMSIFYNDQTGEYKIVNGAFDSYMEYKNEINDFFHLK